MKLVQCIRFYKILLNLNIKQRQFHKNQANGRLKVSIVVDKVKLPQLAVSTIAELQVLL